MSCKKVIFLVQMCAAVWWPCVVSCQSAGEPVLQDTFQLSHVTADINQDTVLRINSFTIGADTISGYKKEKDFAYINYLDSLLKQSKDLGVDTLSSEDLKGHKKLNRSNAKGSGTSVGSGNEIFRNPFIRFILTTLAVFFIGFILYRIFFNGFFKRNGAQLSEENQQPQETEPDQNAYNILVQQAIAVQNYRLAVRYLYLQTLQLLHDKNVVDVSPGKTNENYVKELQGNPHQLLFASLTTSYEYIWYGKFEIGYLMFQQLQNNFKQFQHTL
jgi:Domain of unknown function (DUF4129)